jgi:spore germination protein (amino acid permease)
MKADNKNTISASQMMALLASSLLGTEMLYMARYMVMISQQDGWIYAILGSVYGVFIVFMTGLFCKYYPDNNILFISKKIFGKIIGSILNFFFLFQFIFYTVLRISQLSNLIRVYIVYFLNSKIVMGITVLVTAYACYKGFQSLSRLNEALFYLTTPILFVTVVALTYGNILNVMPVFQDGFSSFFMKFAYGAYGFYGIELFLLIYPFINDKKKVKKAGYTSVAFTCVIYTWFVFISIDYLGIDIIPKYLWPVLTTVKAANLRAIRNFSYIFIYFWILIALKSITVHYYASSLILNDLISKIKISSFCIYLIPLMYYLASKLDNEILGRNLMTVLIPAFYMYNLLFISILAIFVSIKKGKRQ